MIKSLLTIIAFCFSLATFAQNPSLHIEKVNSENYCLGTELSIDVTITGVFPANNKSTVVAFRNWDDPAKRWEYLAELKGGKLVAILKDHVLANSESFGLRVLSSDPKTETDANYSLKALTKSTVKLTSRWGYSADTLNSTDLIELTFKTTPMSPGKVTLNNGDTFELQYSSYDVAGSYITIASLPKTKEGNYFIKEANNACGPMNVSGQVTVKINTIDFIPVSISPEQPCEGSGIKVIFNTDKADFNANVIKTAHCDFTFSVIPNVVTYCV